MFTNIHRLCFTKKRIARRVPGLLRALGGCIRPLLRLSRLLGGPPLILGTSQGGATIELALLGRRPLRRPDLLGHPPLLRCLFLHTAGSSLRSRLLLRPRPRCRLLRTRRLLRPAWLLVSASCRASPLNNNPERQKNTYHPKSSFTSDSFLWRHWPEYSLPEVGETRGATSPC